MERKRDPVPCMPSCCGWGVGSGVEGGEEGEGVSGVGRAGGVIGEGWQ